MRRRGGDGIAIIGMAGRFPGAPSVERFWENLRAGVESIVHFTTDDVLAAGVDPATVARADYVRAKGVLAGIEDFDAAFFGFSPREAALTDPQHRVFLECCWEALEQAGYNPSGPAAITGVYAGAGVNTYLLVNLMASGVVADPARALQVSIHNKIDHLTTRVAYKLNLRGPAITVQTACSSSLVAVCLACQSLLSFQNDLALAGGVNISVPQIGGYLYQEGGTASPDGHCRAFDARARGTVEGNGAGVVVLKRLADALTDGDHVLAVIKGAAMNNDGADKQGYTAPGVNSQAEVIAMAQAIAGVEPQEISYVEAHGTGTVLGDPIEVAALSQAFGRGTQAGHCTLGSVKTNIGHLDAAAGVAGLIKTVLALQHRMIPPSLHFDTPNPRIDFKRSGFRVSRSATEWIATDTPRRAGVSSFGIGGTNAHVVLEEAPEQPRQVDSDGWHVLPLSAATESALERTTERLAAHFVQHPEAAIGDVAYTLQVGRAALPHRRVVICRSAADARQALESLTPARVASRHQPRLHRPVAFVFPGQGTQYADMAAGLYRAQKAFGREIDRCAELLQPHLPVPLRELLFPAETRSAEASQLLDRTDFTQPALFTIEYALARWWMALGLRPQAMFGHSIGEYVAACIAGVFRLEDALAAVALRGRLMQELPEGMMLAVDLSERELVPLLGREIDVAAVNGAAQCVIAGARRDAERCEAALVERGISVRRLPAMRAFHSAMTEPAAAALAKFLGNISLNAPQIPYLSNVTGTWIRPDEATNPAYWARQLRLTVRCAAALDELLRIADLLVIEVGPGKVLRTLVRWHPNKSASQSVVTSLPSRDAPEDGHSHALRAVGEAWLAGVDVNWPDLHDTTLRQRVPLPTYPFERQRFWIEPQRAPRAAEATTAGDWFYVPVWNRSPLTAREPLTIAGRRWMILRDRAGFADRVAESLRARGALVVSVAAGDDYQQIAPDSFCVRATNRADYDTLLESLRTSATLPEFIVHAWTVDDPPPSERARVVDLAFHSIIALVQALGERSPHTRSLIVVSTGLHNIVDGDVITAEKATVLGAVRVVAQEYAHLQCRSMDVTRSAVGRLEEDAITAMIREQLAAGSEQVSAWRAGERWVQDFNPSSLRPAAGPSLLRERGTYLITGGFGGVGQQIAQYLARTNRARLVLLGRQGTSTDRPSIAQNLDARGINARAAVVQRLERDGAEVVAVAADVSDAAAMAGAFEQAQARFGRIDGVVHAAGMAGGGLIQWRDQKAMTEVLRPKVMGTRVLEPLIEMVRPDFVVLASSLASVVGRPGQADYAAANAFLDAFAAEFMGRTRIPVVSINWPEWHGTGMAATGMTGSPGSAPFHPLLAERTIAASGVETYKTRFRVDTHWVLDEHRLLGTAVIPGTAFIEMVRAALANRVQGRIVEIRDLYFLAPLRVRNDQTREVRLVLSPTAAGFDFMIESDVAGDDGTTAGVTRYASGQATLVDGVPPPAIDVEALASRCRRRETPREEDREDDLGPRWQNVVVSHVGDSEVLVRLELAEGFSSDLEKFQYHPALMDRATGRAQEHLAAGSFLPVSYRRIRIYNVLPRTVYSHARLHREIDPSEETLTFDTRVVDAAGATLVDVEGFMQRRINDPGAAIRAFAATGASRGEARAAAPRPVGMSPAEGVETFARIIAARVGPQVVVAPHDLRADRARSADAVQVDAIDAAHRLDATAAQRHPRPQLDTPYAAPVSDLERLLTSAWEHALGIEQVGVQDNFFALGGDSVQAIQIIARLAALDVRLSPQQFFQHQTISDLASALSAVSPLDGQQATPTVDSDFALAGLDESGLKQLATLIEEADALAPPTEQPAGGTQRPPLPAAQ